MSQRSAGHSDGLGFSYLTGSGEMRERGARRKKIAGYFKAANDLRQSYQATYTGSRGNVEQGDNLGIPGAFPDVSITRHGDEELVLFPSYCKRHTKEEPNRDRQDSGLNPNSGEHLDAEYWKREWERFESDKAVVDVDVRGWVYSPHKGPMTRKNRLLVGLARQLSGIPAPQASAGSRENSPEPVSLRARHEAHQAHRDQERIAQEAEEILKKGEGEAAIAAQGRFSEKPAEYDSDSDTTYGDRGRRSGSHTPNMSPSEVPGPGHLPKRPSWNQPSEMSQDELSTANSHLMARLMPFMTNPLAATPITVFFYDKKTSQSKTVVTNDSGHFNIRAALDFVPTHVRILASENLSTTVEVKITEPKGVSLISDVDDTVKHSSIGAGAREIFRNAFIRDLADLTIEGVKEWYNTMYDMGVGIHYVSNSPWQLFPVLVSFFQTAGLPPGSYHLKQYSGMLQGIFEPVAERKKGTLERILRDFPERRFLLIGDSGEADLEVYTDVAVTNPGRVIGIFIRDVTTPSDHGFFDSTMNAISGDHRSGTGTPRGQPAGKHQSHRLADSDSPQNRPPLPTRNVTEATLQTSTGPAMGNLIDFDDEPEEIKAHQPHKTILPRSNSDLEHLDIGRRWSSPQDIPKPKVPPLRPAKPAALRSNTTDSSFKSPLVQISSQASPPPLPSPREPRPKSTTDHPLSQTQNTSEFSPLRSDPNQSYLSSAREKVSSAYNSLPSFYSDAPSQRPLPPPRRGITATAASYLPSSNRPSWNDSGRNSIKSANSSDDEGSNDTPVNKKLDLWRRRWRRAQEILSKDGVELRSWKRGEDCCVEAIQLVEKHMKELGVEGYGDNKEGKGRTGEGGGEVKVKDLKR